jgi:hypothetical protein
MFYFITAVTFRQFLEVLLKEIKARKKTKEEMWAWDKVWVKEIIFC